VTAPDTIAPEATAPDATAPEATAPDSPAPAVPETAGPSVVPERPGWSLGVAAEGELRFFPLEETEVPDGGFRVVTVCSGLSAGTELSYVKGTNPYLDGSFDPDLRVFSEGPATTPYPITTMGYMEVGRVVVSRDAAIEPGQLLAMRYGHADRHTGGPDTFRVPLPDDLDPVLGVFVAHMGPICANGLLHAAAESVAARDVVPAGAGASGGAGAATDRDGGRGGATDAAAGAVDLGDGVRGRNVLVVGAGVVGLLTGLFARHLGAAEVVVADPTPERRAAAEQLGLIAIDDPGAAAAIPGAATAAAATATTAAANAATAAAAATSPGTGITGDVAVTGGEADTSTDTAVTGDAGVAGDAAVTGGAPRGTAAPDTASGDAAGDAAVTGGAPRGSAGPDRASRHDAAIDPWRWCKERWVHGPGDRGADVVFQCRGRSAALATALRALRPQRSVIDLAFYQGGASDLRLGEEFHHNGLSVRCAQISRVPRGLEATWDRRRLAAATLDLLADHGEAVRRALVTDVVPIAHAPAVIRELADRRRHALQVVFSFDGPG